MTHKGFRMVPVRAKQEIIDAMCGEWFETRPACRPDIKLFGERMALIYEAGIAAAPSPQGEDDQWVSSETLPEIGVDVLCWFGDHVPACVGTYSGHGIWQDSNGSMDEFDMVPVLWKRIELPQPPRNLTRGE